MNTMALREESPPVAELHFEGDSLEVLDSDCRSKEPMKGGAKNKPTHIVKGNIFDALGFSASEASALKVSVRATHLASDLLIC